MSDQVVYTFPEEPIPSTLTEDQVYDYYSLQVTCPTQCAPGTLWAKQKAQYTNVYTTPVVGAPFKLVKKITVDVRMKSMEEGAGLACLYFGNNPATMEWIMDPQV